MVYGLWTMDFRLRRNALSFYFLVKIFHHQYGCADQFGIKTEFGDEQLGAARKARDTIFMQRLLNRGQQYFSHFRTATAQHDGLGVHDMDENGQRFAYFVTGIGKKQTGRLC